ncbi:hypothetical protein ACT7DA_16115 [Bacillus pacificus]
MGKVAQEFSTIEKVAAKLGNLNHSLPENSIKAINVPKHIIKNLKPFGIPAVLINSAFEVGELHTALKSDKTVTEGVIDFGYSGAKIAGNTFFGWAGGVGGVEARSGIRYTNLPRYRYSCWRHCRWNNWSYCRKYSV